MGERRSDQRPSGHNNHLLKNSAPPNPLKILFSPSGSVVGFIRRSPEELAEIEREREQKQQTKENTK